MYRITKQEAWSKIIKIRRLKWLGHLYRLKKETPAVKSLNYALGKFKKNKGGQKQTWIKSIEQQLKTMNININDIPNLSINKKRMERYYPRLLQKVTKRYDNCHRESF